MNLPFCDSCKIRDKCLPDLRLFSQKTGNKRIPPEAFCRARYAALGLEYDDHQLLKLVEESGNPHSVRQIYPAITKYLTCEGLPLTVTLMITEKCNLKCKYCYEVFAGNMHARSMSLETAKKAIDYYTSPEIASGYPEIHWDIIGGEVFAELDLLKAVVAYLIEKVGADKLHLSLCSNGTLFTPEARRWCCQMRHTLAYFGVGVSLDGPKHVHDLNRSNSFDRLMESWDWWRAVFPECVIKGTVNPETLKYLNESVRFFVEDLKLPSFYINPTFEGPWTPQDALLYSEQLIDIAEYFLARPEYEVLKNSNIFHDTRYEISERRNWCGSGVYMRAITPDGGIYPCHRGATSQICKIGDLDSGVDPERVKPFFFYTKYNDEHACDDCEFASWCPSCAMEWVEGTGDLYMRSLRSCDMTRARLMVSKYYCERTAEAKP